MRPRPRLVALVTLVATLALAGALPAGASARSAAASAVAPGPGQAALVAAPAQSGDPADDPDGDATTDDEPVPANDIIPEPDSGRPPEDAGDRGGALQVTVFLAIVGGLGTLVALAVRDARRGRHRRASAG